MFRLRFLDWNDLITVDYTVTPQAMAKKAAEHKVLELLIDIIYFNIVEYFIE